GRAGVAVVARVPRGEREERRGCRREARRPAGIRADLQTILRGNHQVPGVRGIQGEERLNGPALEILRGDGGAVDGRGQIRAGGDGWAAGVKTTAGSVRSSSSSRRGRGWPTLRPAGIALTAARNPFNHFRHSLLNMM